MYEFLLIAHNFLRWVVLIFLVLTIIYAFIGIGSNGFKPNKLSLFTLISSHTQLLFGLILYMFSPIIDAAQSNVGVAMKDSQLRFFLVEHNIAMLVAIALITIGRIRLKKLSVDKQKNINILLFYGIALVLILISIPWSRVLIRI